MNIFKLAACCLAISFAQVPVRAETKLETIPEPFVATSTPSRWEREEFSYSIPAFDSGWSINPELSLPPSELDIAREQISFSANSDLTRFELTVWDKNPRHSLKKWFNNLGKELCGNVGVTIKNVKTPTGERAIWANVEKTIQAPQTELFFVASRDQVYCIRYLNKDDGANRAAFEKLCYGFSASPLTLAKKGDTAEKIAAAAPAPTVKVA